MLECVEHSSVQGRALYILDACGVEDLSALRALPYEHYACLLAWDADSADVPGISHAVELLLDSGAVYIASWGQACELVHDVADETVVTRAVKAGVDPPLIMTTWHAEESLLSALWFLTFSGAPGDEYLNTCEATVAISVGSSERAELMRRAFGDLTAFCAQAIAERP